MSGGGPMRTRGLHNGAVAVIVNPMSLAPLLLRVLLMLSLLLNGANAAMAGEYLLQSAGTPAAASRVPPCHDAPEAPPAATTVHGPQGDATPDDPHCRMKECARACAQLPMVGVALLPSLQGPWRAAAPAGALEANRPAPPLPRVVRPPIA